MSSVECLILRVIATADIIVSATLPWFLALTAAMVSVCVALLVRRIVCRLNIM